MIDELEDVYEDLAELQQDESEPEVRRYLERAVRNVRKAIGAVPPPPAPPRRPVPEPEPLPPEPPPDLPDRPIPTSVDQARPKIEAPQIVVPEAQLVIFAGTNRVLELSSGESWHVPGNPLQFCVQSFQEPGKVLAIRVEGEIPYALDTGYSKYNAVTRLDGNGDPMEIEVALVGAGDGTSVINGLRLGGGYGYPKTLQLYGIDLRGPKGAPAPAMSYGRAGDVLLYNVGLLPYPEYVGELYGGAGMKWGTHLYDCQSIHMEGMPRRVVNGVPVRFEEHPWYWHNMGAVYVVACDLTGGNRTPGQYRSPENKGLPRPHGPVLYEENVAEGYGFDWLEHNGGSGLTTWENPDHPTVARRNKITNARYGAMSFGHQPDDQQPGRTPDGRAHRFIWLEENVLTNLNAQRPALMVSSADEVWIVGNTIDGPGSQDIEIDGWWAEERGAPACGKVRIGGNLRVDGQPSEIVTSRGTGRMSTTRPLSESELVPY